MHASAELCFKQAFTSLWALLVLPQERLAHLQRVRAGGDVAEVMIAVRSDLLRNLGNMTNRCGCWVLVGAADLVCWGALVCFGGGLLLVAVDRILKE